MNLRQRCQKVYQTTCQWGFLSVRALAQATNLSKSSVHRLSQKIKRRQNHPESPLWETPEGYQWLKLLVFATIYIFGIKHGVGSEALSEFFELLRLNSQIGISPTALRRLELQMRSQILAYGEQQAKEVKLTNSPLEILAGADETFFPGFDGIILVLMDLVSGYLAARERQRAEGRRQKVGFRLSSPIAFGAFGFKTPAEPKVGGLRLLAGQNPPAIDPSALCLLPPAFFKLSWRRKLLTENTRLGGRKFRQP